jgi:C4-type Zn-finger protein
MKFITKKPEQAKRELREKLNNGKCPSCKKYCIGIIEKKLSRFFIKTIRRKIYNCLNCGCEWNTQWE